MKLFGRATIYGVKGTITYSAAALAVLPESLERRHSADVEEYKDGEGELCGMKVADERFYVDIVIVPDAANNAMDSARAALATLTIPSKVTLSNFPAKSGSDTVLINGDYIYAGGMSESLVKGQATIRLSLFRPLTSAYTVDTLVTQTS